MLLLETESFQEGEIALQKEKAWRAQFLRVMYEYYRFSAMNCATIWGAVEKLLHHDQLELIRTFSDDKATMLINLVATCSKDKEALRALQTIARLDRVYGWTLKRLPGLAKLTTTSLTSLAELIEQVSDPANSKALY